MKQFDMKPFTNLRQIFCYATQIQELESNLFEFNPDIEYINIYNNEKLRSVGVNLFENLTNLKMIDFHYNNCIDKFVNSRSEFPGFVVELAEKCPPNSAMSSSRSIITEKKPQVLTDKLAELEAEINELKLRLAKCKSCNCERE